MTAEEDWSAPDGWWIQLEEELDSTNEELKRLGPEEGHVLVAERQTAGRGRRGAEWMSEAGEGLTFSVALRPTEPRGLWPRLALATGLAVAEALGRLGFEAEVKWPNDVLIGRNKVCGILVEATSHGAIIGIGINVNTLVFPAALKATSLKIESGVDWPRAEVLAVVLQSLKIRVGQIGADFPTVIEALRERCALQGRRVSLHSSAGPMTGLVHAIGDAGELVIEDASGLHRLLQADEVRVID